MGKLDIVLQYWGRASSEKLSRITDGRAKTAMDVRHNRIVEEEDESKSSSLHSLDHGNCLIKQLTTCLCTM